MFEQKKYQYVYNISLHNFVTKKYLSSFKTYKCQKTYRFKIRPNDDKTALCSFTSDESIIHETL